MTSENIMNSEMSIKKLSLNRLFRSAVLSRLKKISNGSVTVRDNLGVTVCGTKGSEIEIQINDDDMYYLMGTKGALGAGEAYIKGLWECSDLHQLVRILAANSDALDSLESGTASLKNMLNPIFHFMKRNSIVGSKNNIKAHYDLSDALFQSFLDSSMMYSAGFYESKESTLEDAATAKLERICRKLDLNSEDHVLEIGTGWGGFAIYAAKNFGCKITTTTISDNQFEYAKRQVDAEGLGDLITLLKKDYRDLTGKFDKLVSIEMIEAVGADFLDTYLEKCSDLLKPEGSMLIQAITINDQVYKRALNEVDFIKKYIFPGSFIPSLNAISNSASSSTDLRMYSMEDMTPHYEKTLLDWQKRFNLNFDNIKHLGFDEEFKRMWNFYFSYCAGGFAERTIGSVQIVLGKPRFRSDLSKRTLIKKGGM